MWKEFVRRLADSPVDTGVSRFADGADEIARMAAGLRGFSDPDLRRIGTTDQAATLALVVEAACRTLGLRPYPVQILAALALAEGSIIEMQTGEGKTLVATMSVVMHALAGNKCHVLTFNDYLARRDGYWMRPLYEFFGLEVGIVQRTSTWEERQQAYRCDVTYATAKEAGFDYLRSQLCTTIEARLHTRLDHVLIDEADAILVDEARIPLVIARSADDQIERRREVDALVALLDDSCWETDIHRRNIVLTDRGIHRVEAGLGCGSLHEAVNRPLLTQVNQALHAYHLLSRDVDYIVSDDEVQVVDELTGRVAVDRRWPDGLHAALEAKEGVTVRDDGHILSSITIQHFVRLYSHISGMSATSQEDAAELELIYGTKVVPVPPNRPSKRKDCGDVVFQTKSEKLAAVVDEVQREHSAGRPVLIGTATIEESECVALEIERVGLPCRVLNATNDAAEAEIVADAGLPGAITISTNMAGRGTDIKLGGADEAERDAAYRAGGLHVIGTSHFESVRIDRQLRGRAGRQGDPGSSRFIVSLEDDLMVRFRVSDYIRGHIHTSPGDGHLRGPEYSNAIRRLQRVVASQNSEIRTTLWKYSQLLESQRRATTHWRDAVMSGHESVLGACWNYDQLLDEHGPSELAEIEKRTLLKHIDDLWAEQLSVVADIREGAHLTIRLTDIGGLDPFLSYRQRIHDAFKPFREKSIERLIHDLESKVDPINPMDTGRPAGTWTYLVNDDFFGEHQRFLQTHVSSGTASLVVLLTWPFMLVSAIWRRVTQRSTYPDR